MSSYAMQAALDNGFSLMTDCLTVTQFMLNSFLLFNFTSVILLGCAALSSAVGEVLGCALELTILPPVMIPLLYSIVLFSA